MAVLVLNAGSSSLKMAVFDIEAQGAVRVLDGRVAGIGAAPELILGGRRERLGVGADHATALAALLDAADAPIEAVGHRVVHGGDLFDAPIRLEARVMTALEGLNALAPLHNPVALGVIRAASAALPQAAQIAAFDTAFHACQPEVARRFALPERPETDGLKRYGFHGLSYQSVVERFDPPPPRLLACHLGAGASLCAIKDGVGVASTMGYSPLDGLTMGTRSGSIDPSAVLELARRVGLEEAERLLTRASGLLGLSGESAEMRSLEASDSAAARFAIDHFIYWTARHAGSMIAALGGLDAVVFTGGVGENSDRVRSGVAAALGWTGLALGSEGDDAFGPEPEGLRRISAANSRIAAYVAAADEEGVIARAARRVLSLGAE